ncbi:T9SS type A sorting domain-containing protein [uncultured Hymenobacter sp.]|uniref:T9SS type A sorting domain-containing protein n=1 Tax=uncultured Hymenobacter sp. TaxID=170016 RepID=UPI0035CC8680
MNSITLYMSDLRSINEVQVTVSNALGQTVQQFTVRPQAGALHHPLDLASLPAGVYSICVRTAEGTITKRLVRE